MLLDAGAGAGAAGLQVVESRPGSYLSFGALQSDVFQATNVVYALDPLSNRTDLQDLLTGARAHWCKQAVTQGPAATDVHRGSKCVQLCLHTCNMHGLNEARICRLGFPPTRPPAQALTNISPQAARRAAPAATTAQSSAPPWALAWEACWPFCWAWAWPCTAASAAARSRRRRPGWRRKRPRGSRCAVP